MGTAGRGGPSAAAAAGAGPARGGHVSSASLSWGGLMELQAGRGDGEARPREEGDWKEDGNRKGKNKKRGVSTLGRKTCASLVSPAQDFFFFVYFNRQKKKKEEDHQRGQMAVRVRGVVRRRPRNGFVAHLQGVAYFVGASLKCVIQSYSYPS
jgi:hypothetical protein